MDWLMTTVILGGCALAVVGAIAISLLISDVNPPAADAGTNKDVRPD